MGVRSTYKLILFLYFVLNFKFMMDRGDYLKKEEEYRSLKLNLQKDYIEFLIEQYNAESKSFQKFIEVSKNRITDFRNKVRNQIIRNEIYI